jgi:DNA-directed RNA polymerase subunit A"
LEVIGSGGFVDIEKVEKVVKKKRTKFPEKLIYEIADAA